jgi:hypothetical protein
MEVGLEILGAGTKTVPIIGFGRVMVSQIFSLQFREEIFRQMIAPGKSEWRTVLLG